MVPGRHAVLGEGAGFADLTGLGRGSEKLLRIARSVVPGQNPVHDIPFDKHLRIGLSRAPDTPVSAKIAMSYRHLFATSVDVCHNLAAGAERLGRSRKGRVTIPRDDKGELARGDALRESSLIEPSPKFVRVDIAEERQGDAIPSRFGDPRPLGSLS